MRSIIIRRREAIRLENGMELVPPQRGTLGITPRMRSELAKRHLNHKTVAEILSPVKGLSSRCCLRYTTK
jgi:hypothetical protein